MSIDKDEVVNNETNVEQSDKSNEGGSVGVGIDGGGDDDTRTLDSKNFMKTRSQSLQSTSTTATLAQQQVQTQHQLTHQSSSMTQQTSTSFHKTISSSSSTALHTSTGTKSKFQSFLQHPDTSSSHGGTYLSVQHSQQNQQKHVRQFVRSASAHADGNAVTQSKTIKTLRSTSQQIEDELAEHHLRIQQDSATAVLISKSAENLETKVQFGSANRSQLTLSGGFLAPPNRKLTILSPVHSAPGLHEMILKRQGRSPCSPKITFPGSDNDLFL